VYAYTRVIAKLYVLLRTPDVAHDISAVMPDHGLHIGPRVLSRGDICHLNAENQGSSQVSGSSLNSGMQIEISHCRRTARTWVRVCVHVCINCVRAYIIYRITHTDTRGAMSSICYCKKLEQGSERGREEKSYNFAIYIYIYVYIDFSNTSGTRTSVTNFVNLAILLSFHTYEFFNVNI